MAISVVQNHVIDAAWSGNFASNVAAGNTVLIWAYQYSNAGSAMSSSNPLFGGSSVSGASKLFDGQPAGANSVYGALWMLPNVAGGATSVGLTNSGGTVDSNVGLIVAEVSGLGATPALDSGASPNPHTATGSTANPASGSTGNITQNPEIILGLAVIFGQAVTGPGAPWTTVNGGSTFTAAAWQVVTSSGSSYAYNTTGTAGNWIAGVAAVYAGSSSSPAGTAQPRATIPVPRRRAFRASWAAEIGALNAHGPNGAVPALMTTRTEVTGRSTGRIIRR